MPEIDEQRTTRRDRYIVINDPQSTADDEIDLIELLRLLFARKAIILCLTVIGFAFACFYAFSRPVLYQSLAKVSLPIGVVKFAPINGSPLPVKDLYKLFFDNVNSPLLQSDVWAEMKLAGYSFTVNSKKGTVALKGATPDVLVTAINTLLLKSEQKTLNIYRQERLALLRDALAVAEMAEIIEPVLTDFNSPLYFYGSKILKAELHFLEEPMEVGLPRKTLSGLENEEAGSSGQLALGIDNLHVVRLVQPALTPSLPMAQKRGLIIAIGTVLGFIVSIVLVFGLNLKNKIVEDD